MCEQTEISYLDGDVVWVKLGACWWPGQVTGSHNLPEDIQQEFKKKPLIAAVKFFQEDTYEFVKNYQQIYKYNCTLKEEFIKKGLDKYRIKSKDGASYMDKFPGDVEMAEKLTGGDPDILTSDKFSPEEKPDISALFGEKKVSKKRRDRDDANRRSDGDGVRKITHPRFLKESDHEIRIRQQPSSLPSTPNNSTASPQYPCHVCNFTSSRVNVIICHIKSHRSGNSMAARSKVKTYSQPRSKISDSETPKRKYVRKERGHSYRNKGEHESDSGKRKHAKQVEKSNKKKKTDPELREKLLADWDDESDEEGKLDSNKSMDSNSADSSPLKHQTDTGNTQVEHEDKKDMEESDEIIEGAKRLLSETEKLTMINLSEDTLIGNSQNSEKDKRSSNFTKDTKQHILQSTRQKLGSEKDGRKSGSEKEGRNSGSEKDDKKARLSCFDFDEEDLPEPTMPPVRKIPRVFGEKNLSLKKEIIKEFEMSQALKNEQEKGLNGGESAGLTAKQKRDVKNDLVVEIVSKEGTDGLDIKNAEKYSEIVEKDDLTNKEKDKTAEEFEGNILSSKDNQEKLNINVSETELEIVEIFEVEREEETDDDPAMTVTKSDFEKEQQSDIVVETKLNVDRKSMETVETLPKSGTAKGKGPTLEETMLENMMMESEEIISAKEKKAVLGRTSIEAEDETVSELAVAAPMQSENSDTEGTSTQFGTSQSDDTDVDSMAAVSNNAKLEKASVQVDESIHKNVKRHRGRPRKSMILNKGVINTTVKSVDGTPLKINDKRLEAFEKSEEDRKTSDSDTEHLHSGRRRRGNKKYTKSEMYFQSSDQKSSKTDESQSESDDRSVKARVSPEQRKNKNRRGRTLSDFSNKSIEQIKGQEYELSDSRERSLDAADENVDASITGKSEKVKEKLDANKSLGMIKKSDEENVSLESHSESSKSDKKSSDVQQASTVCSMKVTKMLASSEDKPSEIVQTSTKSKTKTLVINDMLKVDGKQLKSDEQLSKHDVENETESKEVDKNSNIQEQLDALFRETEDHQLPEMSKSGTEKFPPKKSQIKKIELLQTDFFDSSASTEKKIQSEPEKKINKLDDMEIEITRVDPNDETLDRLAEEGEKGMKLKDGGLSKSVEREVETDDMVGKLIMEKKLVEPDVTIDRDVPKEVEQQIEVQLQEKVDAELKLGDAKETLPKNELEIELVPKLSNEQSSKRSSIQTRYKGKFTPETGAKPKKEKDATSEEKPVNSFQEAFLKTLQIDKREKKMVIDDIEITVGGRGKRSKKLIKKKTEDVDNVNIVSAPQTSVDEKFEKQGENVGLPQEVSNIEETESVSTDPTVSDFQGIEVVVEENIDAETKLGDSIFQEGQFMARATDVSTATAKHEVHLSNVDDITKTLSLDLQKLDDCSRMSMSTPSPTSDVGIPVKKREKPRIIENVALKEPMQILKSKLLEKLPPKGIKHKLEPDATKKDDSKGSPRTKMMKIDSPSNSKVRQPTKIPSAHLSLTKKLQALKAEEAATAAAIESQNEKVISQTTQTISATPMTEKFVQQSSQSLADMELDINSMPFVLSEDVLTPENIEQMPVVISSIIPASSTITTASISLTPTSQIVTPNQVQYKSSSEIGSEVTPGKKKSGMPTILKNKGKAKPTITSIKTLVPPLTGGVKGLKFQNTQTAKASPLITQKGSPGKYVIVQTSGGQQLRYSVQGKPGIQQKLAIPTGKSTGSAQIVQQGGKVVILTSAQSGQTKMLPLNISKTLSGKVQRIMTSKGQVFSPINPQGIISSKTIIAPKTDVSTATTSKLATQGQKIINTQGIITSKGVLTPIPGTITKSALLSTLSQGILTKGGIYTPISASPLTGKTIIGSKTLVTTKGTTILSPLTSQSLVSSKAILTPISQSITGKTILSAQSIVASKGTVLTPITGQQVKAIAAKSPSKGGKIQYQSMQQKMQLPVLQKCQKLPMSSSSQMRVTGSLKTPGSTILFQNTVPGQKTLLHGKKVVKQTVLQQQGLNLPALSSQSGSQQGTSTVSQGHQKGKVLSTTSTMQKVVIPRNVGRQTKAQQKIVVQKIHEPTVSAQNMQSKLISNVTTTTVPAVAKTIVQHKYAGTSSPRTSTKNYASNKNSQQQKNLLNVALNSVTTSTPVSTNLAASLSLPALEPIEPEKKSKLEELSEDVFPKEEPKLEPLTTVEHLGEVNAGKIEEPKITSQPQIMALPTDSGDGTQTYVLVTIDEQGQIQPLDNNTLMSLEGTTQNPDGTRTLYIDPSSLGEAGTLDNIVLQFDNGSLPNLQTNVSESNQAIISESFRPSEIIQTSNQDILAAALANTDFQQEIGLPENPSPNVMTAGLTQTSLINQTILQSTIIPPTEPISSPSVLETSLTLNQPIMTPLEVPSNLPIQSESTPTSVVSTIPSSLELPITITNPSISYISAGEAQIQIPGNSMPDIGEIMESPVTEIPRTEVPASTQYLVIPNLDENITIEAQGIQSGAESVPTVSYSVSIPDNIVMDATQVQTTPSMPIIDDTYSEDVQYTTSIETSMAGEQSFTDVPVSEMLVSKAPIVSTENAVPQDVSVPSEMIVTSHEVPVSSEEVVTPSENSANTLNETKHISVSSQDVFTSQEVPVTTEELILQQAAVTTQEDTSTCVTPVVTQEEVTQEVIANDDQTLCSVDMQIEEHGTEVMATSMPVIEENNSTITTESNVEVQSTEHLSFEVTDSSKLQTNTSDEMVSDPLNQPVEKPATSEASCSVIEEQVATTNQDQLQTLPKDSIDNTNEENMEMEPSIDTEIYTTNKDQPLESSQMDEPSSQEESNRQMIKDNLEVHFEEAIAETSQETPSQSYEQFDVSMTSDSTEVSSQSANKSENSREPSQSIVYESMETNEDIVSGEPPTQSFEDSKQNEASQSYETSTEEQTNAPTQSFNEIVQSQDDRTSVDDMTDDQSFPTQSYEVEKVDNLSENMETDAEISQEGNVPTQSNDIGTDGIGTSSVSTNNSGVNEDETASSSYVPETPENQERDQDQESAISTSSYEIPPCEELNIASSSAIPDTSVRAEHTSIHDNGVPEIPTSSYNLNPDSSSTHVDAVPSSSYEDQVILEQNVSTSYDVPISMPGLEETSQSFVTESSDHRDEPTSYYAHHPEVTASYYESVHQESNSRLEEDTQEEVTPSYYEATPEGITSEASQSYFTAEEATPSYSSQSITPSYYDPKPESEASQSYYSAQDLERTEQSQSQNVEASQSFYQEATDELRLRQQGEATPTYSARYPVDYTLANSPIERHDLVESSVPATRPTER